MWTKRPVVITDAQPSPAAQRRGRELRYALLMGIRVICLLIAVLLSGLQVPHPMWWLAACLAGMVILPWCAVQIANEPVRRARPRPLPRKGEPANSFGALCGAPEPVVVDATEVG